MRVKAGVPQRLFLGPLIYINDLTDNLAVDRRLFADDTSLFHTYAVVRVVGNRVI